jgi:hypothetical protein
VSAWGEVESFGAYNADRIFNILGLPQQNFFAQAEAGQGLVGQLTGESDVGMTGDPTQFADIVAGENTQLADPSIPWFSVPGNPSLPIFDPSIIPSWVWWTLGGVATLVTLSILAPYIGLIEKAK